VELFILFFRWHFIKIIYISSNWKSSRSFYFKTISCP